MADGGLTARLPEVARPGVSQPDVSRAAAARPTALTYPSLVTSEPPLTAQVVTVLLAAQPDT